MILFTLNFPCFQLWIGTYFMWEVNECVSLIWTNLILVFEKLTFVITMIDTIISTTNIVPNINFFLSVSLHAMIMIPQNKVLSRIKTKTTRHVACLWIISAHHLTFQSVSYLLTYKDKNKPELINSQHLTLILRNLYQ